MTARKRRKPRPRKATIRSRRRFAALDQEGYVRATVVLSPEAAAIVQARQEAGQTMREFINAAVLATAEPTE